MSALSAGAQRVMSTTDEERAAYYAASAAQHRATAEAFRCKARAALLDPMHDLDYRNERAAEYLELADSHERLARECLEGEA